jgi:hypothetical protein
MIVSNAMIIGKSRLLAFNILVCLMTYGASRVHCRLRDLHVGIELRYFHAGNPYGMQFNHMIIGCPTIDMHIHSLYSITLFLFHAMISIAREASSSLERQSKPPLGA